MKRRVGWGVILTTAVLFAGTANATYTCSGPVSGVVVSRDGVVAAQNFSGLNWVYLCSLTTPINGVSVDACKGIYSLLITAQATGKSVVTWFNDDPKTCASHPAWAWLTDWYWGPMLQD
jgi:hypothetical protein